MNVKELKKALRRVPSTSEVTITDHTGHKRSFTSEEISYKLYSNNQWEVNITLEDLEKSYQEMSLEDALDKMMGFKK